MAQFCARTLRTASAVAFQTSLSCVRVQKVNYGMTPARESFFIWKVRFVPCRWRSRGLLQAAGPPSAARVLPVNCCFKICFVSLKDVCD